MITFTEAQLVTWLSPVIWPFLRVLALFTAAPVFSSRAFPIRARIGLALFFLMVMCLGNLRGLKESGKVFAVPTYFYVTMLMTFLAAGFYKMFTGDLHEINTSA